MPLPLVLIPMAAKVLANPVVREKIKSTLISTAKDKLMPKIQEVVDKYKDDACENPPVFIDRITADMKAAKFFPSPIRLGIEAHRAEIESEMREMLAEPEFQEACKTADVRKITEEIVKVIEEGAHLSGGRRKIHRRKSHRRKSHRRRRITHRRR